VYPDPRVVSFIEGHFVPARVHVKEQHGQFQRLSNRYNAQWTPTVLIIDEGGEERRRFEGFLPADDFLAQLTLGLANLAFKTNEFADAERWFRDVVDRYPKTDAAAEALYWAGVSRYKRTNDAAALTETAEAFRTRYSDTSWATRASVWAK
jgi:thioredoxin family protein